MLKTLNIKNIKDAEKELLKIGVSKEGVQMMKTKAVFRVIKLKDVDIRAANILKQQMLSLGAEAALPKHACLLRDKKSDVILMGTLKQYKKLILVLQKQSFGIKEIGKKLEKILHKILEK